MKLNELKKGNLVNNNNVVCTINHDSVTCFGNSFSGLVSFSEHELKFISINKDWLIKFEFDKVNKNLGNREFYQKGNVVVELIPTGAAIYIKDELLCFIEYVHELQNIFSSNWKIKLAKKN